MIVKTPPMDAIRDEQARAAMAREAERYPSPALVRIRALEREVIYQGRQIEELLQLYRALEERTAIR